MLNRIRECITFICSILLLTGIAGAVDNSNIGYLILYDVNGSAISNVPGSFFAAAYSTSHTSTMHLSYDSTMKCVNASQVYGSFGELYIAGMYPTTSEKLTVTMSLNRSQQFSYAHLHSSVAWVGVRKDLANNYQLYSYWYADNGTKLSSSITATPVNGKLTFSILSYESNRSNIVYVNDSCKMTTVYLNDAVRNLPYVNSIQALHYVTVEPNSVGETDNLSIYELKQEIPRSIVTPYANNNLEAFGIDYPTPQSATNGANYLLSKGGTCTIWVDAPGTNNTIISWDKQLFSNGFEYGTHFSRHLTDKSWSDAISFMNLENAVTVSAFGSHPTSFCSWQNADNVSHATYAYNNFNGMLWRNGQGGVSYLPNAGNLQNSSWEWAEPASIHGALHPMFTHQIDADPAIVYAIDYSKFKTWVDNYKAAGVDIVGFKHYYQNSISQTNTASLDSISSSEINLTISTPVTCNVNVNNSLGSTATVYKNNQLVAATVTGDSISFYGTSGTYVILSAPKAETFSSSESYATVGNTVTAP
jgi:hypothetical protein